MNHKTIQIKTLFFGLPILFLFLFFNGHLNKTNQKPFFKTSAQQSYKNINNDFYYFFNLGNKRFYSGLLWVKTLMDSDLEHYNKKDFNNWMFLRFDTITNLEPKFLQAYQFGGLYLSVVKDDVKGASTIYDKGLKKYPNDHFLNSYAGIHYYIEENNAKKAAELLDKVKYHPKSPKYLPSLVARLKIESNSSLETAYQLLIEGYEKAPENSHIKKKFASSLYSLKAEIDLNCLNNGRADCSYFDFEKQPYIKLPTGKYKAQNTWTPFRIHGKTSSSASAENSQD